VEVQHETMNSQNASSAEAAIKFLDVQGVVFAWQGKWAQGTW